MALGNTLEALAGAFLLQRVVEAIREAKRVIKHRGGRLTVVASICGTDGDPQILDLQVKLLKEAGVFVFYSNAKATAFCCELLKQSRGKNAIHNQ